MKWMWFVAIPLAIGACTAQHQMTKQPDVWELACADVAEQYELEQTCNYKRPDVVRNSLLMQQLIGAYGAFVQAEWRIYLASAGYIATSDYTVEQVEYHESVHAVLSQDMPVGRCKSERIAREMTDKRFGTDSANSGWEIGYRCVAPSQMI